MTVRRSAPALLRTLAFAGAAALLGIGLSLIWARTNGGGGQILTVPVPPPAPAGRIVYPAGHYPQLAMPGGRSVPVHSLLDITRPMHFGDYLWNEKGVPPGRIWVRVDLARQTLSVFRAGHEIGSTVILYGTQAYPTPTGNFQIIQMAKQHRSSSYDVEMPYMLRLTADGVAIHASAVEEGFASHGCVGVPLAFARLLFAQAQRGDRVAILPAGLPAGPPPGTTS